MAKKKTPRKYSDMSEADLQEGVVLALANAIRHLRDAVALFRANSPAGATQSSTSSLEENGRFHILAKAIAMLRHGQPVPPELFSSLDNHHDKLRAGQARPQIVHSVSGGSWQEVQKQVVEAMAKSREQVVHERATTIHNSRTSAQYVDRKDGKWLSPDTTDALDAEGLIGDVFTELMQTFNWLAHPVSKDYFDHLDKIWEIPGAARLAQASTLLAIRRSRFVHDILCGRMDFPQDEIPQEYWRAPWEQAV